jgi:hypothetical protein
MSTRKLRHEKDCLNCGHYVDERFCTHCGQENIEVKEPAVGMIIHAVADYFHFEHTFFSTLKPLLFKPGFLSNEYISGKRESYIYPVRLYIFISVLFFLIILTAKNQSTEPKIDHEGVPTQITAYNEISEKEILSDSVLNSPQRKIDRERTDASSLFSAMVETLFSWQVKDTTVAAYEKQQSVLPVTERDNFLKRAYIKKRLFLREHPNRREAFKEHFLHNFPKIMFLLLPVFALILKLVYFNKKKYYYEHFIYSLHVHSAIFLAVLFTLFLQWGLSLIVDVSDWLKWILIVYVLWYIYRSLRIFYKSTRNRTIFKMAFLFASYAVIFNVFLFLIAAFTFIS